VGSRDHHSPGRRGIVCAIQCWLIQVKKADSANMTKDQKGFCEDKTQNDCE
jgi:hypothetical protein